MITAAGGGGGGLALLLPILLLALFYFVAIRPSQRQRRQVAEVQSKLAPGVEVVTGAGVFGTIQRLEDDAVVLEVAPGVSMRFLRQSIVRIVEPNQPSQNPGEDSAGPSTS